MSDLHLSGESLENIQMLEKFIDHLLTTKSKANLYFLGDIFDFWFGKASPSKKITENLINKLNQYNQTQGKVIFFEGNHDIHLKEWFSKKYNFEVVPEQKQEVLLNQKFILEHGDFFDPEDKGYLFLRKFLRRSWVKFLFVNLTPAFVVSYVGDFFSKLSSKKTKIRSEEKSLRIKNKFLIYAESQLQKHQAQVFIAGHTHERMMSIDYVNNHTIINLGSWFDKKWILGLCKIRGLKFLNLTVE